MLQPAEQSLLGDGWKEVASFEEIDDSDEYESAEEGMDTPHPFLKIGSQLLRGDLTPLIGDEVILGLIRNPSNPSQSSHPPLHATSHRLTFSPVSLVPHDASSVSQHLLGPGIRPNKCAEDAFSSGTGEAPHTRGLFPARDAASRSAPGVGREAGGHISAFSRPSPQGSSSLFATGTLEGVDEAGEGSEQGKTRRGRGPTRQRVVVANMDELRGLDFEIMDERAIIEVGTGEERLVFAKKKAERVAAGLPMSGRGSRGGRLTADPRSEKPAIMVGGLAKVRYPKSGGGGDTKGDVASDEEDEGDYPPAGAVYLAVGGGEAMDKSKGSRKAGRKSKAQKEKEREERDLRRSNRPEPEGEGSGSAVPEGEGEDQEMAEEQEVAVAVAGDEEEGGDHEMADDEIPWQEVNEKV